jgi:hypothetical protein
MIPGSNLLQRALTVINAQTVQWLQSTRTLNAIGQYVSDYSDPVNVDGSFQAVPKRNYQQMGLDLNKTYAMFFVSKSIAVVNRDTAGDHVVFEGKTYQSESDTDWYGVDGWKQITLVLLDNNA